MRAVMINCEFSLSRLMTLENVVKGLKLVVTLTGKWLMRNNESTLP